MVKEATVEASPPAVKEATTVEASPGSPAEGTTCAGLLYLSSAVPKKGGNSRKPLCVGLARQVNIISKGDSSRKAVAKHGQALRDFKYACMGHAVYRNDQLAAEPIRESDLPACEGLVILVGAPSDVKEASRQAELKETSPQSDEGGRVMPRPPTQIRPPGTVRGVTPEDFGTKFIRSAGLVAASLKNNVYRIGNHVKSIVEDIFHSGGSRSK